jgi:enoyl-CoA hydratase
MDAADAIFAGFADAFVPSERLAELKRRLCDPNEGAVSEVLARLAQPAPASRLAARRGDIDRIFAGGDVEAIMHRLAHAPADWGEPTRAALAQKSPKALKLASAAIRQARSLPSLEAALEVEFRLALRLFEDGEFPEGVRALIVDKDRKPAWSPASLGEVTEALLQRYLSPLPAEQELGLAETGAAP